MATITFNYLINRREKMSELCESVNKNKLYFEYVGPTKDLSFYEYSDSKELFNELKDNRIRFNGALKKQQELLKKRKNLKIGGKTPEQKKVIENVENFYKSRAKVFNFFRDYTKLFFDASYEAQQNEAEQGGTELKILTPQQMFQR